MKLLPPAMAGLGACAAVVASTYVLEVLSRVADAGRTSLGGDVIALVYATFLLGAAFALPALRSATGWLRRAALLVVSANVVMLLCWAILTLGGWVGSDADMMR